MITLHKTEIAHQNNTLSVFFETPQNFTNHIFRGAHVLLRGFAPCINVCELNTDYHYCDFWRCTVLCSTFVVI